MTIARENSSNDANSCFLHVERAGGAYAPTVALSLDCGFFRFCQCQCCRPDGISFKLAGTILILTKQTPETPALASLGEFFGVIVSLIDWPALAIAIVAAILAIRFRVSAIWLVLGGALAGLVLS